MRPLLYLFGKSFVNSLKRSLTSPKRMISLIAFGLYYYLLVIRSFVPNERHANFGRLHGHLSLPSYAILDAWIFAIMSGASLFMIVGVLTYRGGFRPADVDVLFPTPVNPTVVLVFRILRDYLFTLVAPLVFALLGWHGTSVGLQALFAAYPTHGGDVLRLAWVAWALMSLGWVTLGYGASMFVNRSDLQSDRNRLIIVISVGAIVTFVLGYIAISLRQEYSWQTAFRLSHSPILRTLLFPATAATAVVMGSFQGDPILLSLGLIGAASIVVIGLAIAITQVGWLYDQAAARGFDAINMRKLRRSGDTFGILAERARAGKLNNGRLAKRISQLTFSGAASLVWKDLVLQARGSLSGFPVIAGICVVGNIALLWAINGGLQSKDVDGSIIELAIAGFIAYFFGVIAANGGSVEFLRRVDLLKPLPFTSTKIVMGEVIAKVPIIAFVIFVTELAGLAMMPSAYQGVISAMVLGPCAALVIISAVVLSVVIFPDVDDPTQRGLRGLLMLLSMAIGSLPGVGLFLLLVAVLKVPMIVAAIPCAMVMLAVTAAMASASGGIYASYNPSE